MIVHFYNNCKDRLNNITANDNDILTYLVQKAGKTKEYIINIVTMDKNIKHVSSGLTKRAKNLTFNDHYWFIIFLL